MATSTRSNVQVVARAGSGKTRVLVARTLVLLEMLDYSPGEILLLAFNKKAAQEMRERLENSLGTKEPQSLPHVMTFDALAYALVQPLQTILSDDEGRGVATRQSQVATLQSRIREHLKSESIRADLQHLQLAPFRADWDFLTSKTFDLEREADGVRSTEVPPKNIFGRPKFRTYGSHPVKSHGEATIANILFEHNADYRYEWGFRWDDGSAYRPDFTVFKDASKESGVIIEYFGLINSGHPKHAAYKRRAESKREYWKRKAGWDLIELVPDDLSKGKRHFDSLLIDGLNGHGVRTQRLIAQKIISLARDIGVQGDDYTEPLTQAVIRLRAEGWAPSDLQQMLNRHSPVDNEEKAFLTVATEIYNMYLRDTIGEAFEDYSGVMWKAVDKVKAGETTFKRAAGKETGDLKRLKTILIDEFQDFNTRFHELVQAVQTVNPEARVFCVGDDWQAINRFAGSHTKFFKNFDEYFKNRKSEEHVLRHNFRSGSSIVRVSNALMAAEDGGETGGKASENKRGRVRLWHLDKFEPSPNEFAVSNGEPLIAAVARLVKANWEQGQETVVLSRTKQVIPGYKLDAFEKAIETFVPAQAVLCVNTHQYKGLENDAVIIVDLREGRYPLVHPHWKFQRIFGEEISRIEADERNLLYVALTRAEHTLDLITDSKMFDRKKAQREEGQGFVASRFLDDMKKHLQLMNWDSMPPADSETSDDYIRISVSGPYDVMTKGNPSPKDLLKADGYRWNANKQAWEKYMPQGSDDNYELLKNEPWYRDQLEIDVLDGQGSIIWSKRAGLF